MSLEGSSLLKLAMTATPTVEFKDNPLFTGAIGMYADRLFREGIRAENEGKLRAYQIEQLEAERDDARRKLQDLMDRIAISQAEAIRSRNRQLVGVSFPVRPATKPKPEPLQLDHPRKFFLEG